MFSSLLFVRGSSVVLYDVESQGAPGPSAPPWQCATRTIYSASHKYVSSGNERKRPVNEVWSSVWRNRMRNTERRQSLVGCIKTVYSFDFEDYVNTSRLSKIGNCKLTGASLIVVCRWRGRRYNILTLHNIYLDKDDSRANAPHARTCG